MKNYINKDYYLPLLKIFCDKTFSLYDRGYDQGPFIPYTMSNYGRAPLRIMYVGRDTYSWESVETLKKAYQENRLEDYLEANMKCVDVDIMLKWKNNSGSFWNFANKLHLLIRTGMYIPDIATINEKQKEILEEIGYGNLYSIELHETIKKRYGDSNLLETPEYQIICEAAKPFESVKSMIEAYQPDYIFVLSWIDKDFLDGTDFLEKKEWYEAGFRAVYISKYYPTKVIWSLHPRRFSFMGTNPEEMCHYLTNTFYQLESE